MKLIRFLPPVVLALTSTACTSEDPIAINHWQLWVSLLGVLVQIGIAWVGWRIASSVRQAASKQKELEDERVAREEELENARIALEKEVQDQRDRLHAFDGYRRELGRFADVVIDVMGEIQTLIAFNPDRATVPAEARQQFVEERSRLIGRTSSLIDRGRFFFPNQMVSGIGEHKEAAHRGLRDPVLSRILAAEHVLMATNYEHFDRNGKSWIRWKTLTTVASGSEGHVCSAFQRLSKAEQSRLAEKLTKKDGIRLMDLIVSSKRAFVSEVFDILQPSSWLQQVESAYGINLSSRQPEEPSVHISPT